MAEDPYSVLGVLKGADVDAVRSAYRKLAKTLHPDARPGDKAAEERFKKVSAAFNFLSDADRKAAYDRGVIDAEGNRRMGAEPFGGFGARPRARAGAGGGPGATQGGGFDDLSEFFSEVFGARDKPGFTPGFGGSGARSGAIAGDDVRYALKVSFEEAALGQTKRVKIADGRTLEVALPAGVQTGQVLRLKGQGRPGAGGAPAGDAFVEITINPHRFFTRDGDDVVLDLPISLNEAVLGAKIRAPTVDGAVMLSVPKGANTGAVLRLRGKGAQRSGGGRGDQRVRLVVHLPEDVDDKLEAFVKSWRNGAKHDPRADWDL
ncbi:MAG: DnaJ C-terminal domain-containing protein [Maricaulaceae bacterium]